MSELYKSDFLVIGAGLAGLAFASDIQKTGATVHLVDKGRGIGGRMATRRLREGEATVSVDHGAQFFTAREPRLKALVKEGMEQEWLGVWAEGFPLWKDGIIEQRPGGHPRYAPFAGMNDFAKRLGAGLDLSVGQTITEIRRVDGGYTAHSKDGKSYFGTSLILNLPPHQLLSLARNLLTPSMISDMEAVEFLPAWSLLALLGKEIPNAEWPAIEFQGHPVLGWLSRDNTKRGANATPAIVALGSGEWSREHLEDDADSVQAMILAAVTELVGELDVRTVQVHRWRYALPLVPMSASYLWDSRIQIGCCGDWCGGSRVEGAMESGWGLAGAVSTL